MFNHKLKIMRNWQSEHIECVEKIQDLGGYEAVERAIHEIANLKVLVVGEPILDIYRFCNPEGISSKSPSISARFVNEETYEGGSLAIQNHLRGFAKEVVLQCPNTEIIKKIRYISEERSQRIFEVTHIDDKLWDKQSPDFFIDKMLETAKKADVVILADFGHGLFEGQVLKAVETIKPFIGTNVQTNSSNFGFNRIGKHWYYDYLCVDAREARVELGDRYSEPKELGRKIFAKSGGMMGLTLGANGAMLFSSGEYYAPAFADIVIDAIGAGDAYFAITTCLLKSGCKDELVPFIGNVFAGLKTKILGNKTPVSKESLLTALKLILA